MPTSHMDQLRDYIDRLETQVKGLEECWDKLYRWLGSQDPMAGCFADVIERMDELEDE